MAPRFDTAFEVPYGIVEPLSPLVRRVVAHNPGPFTFKGTATFIVGTGEVAVIDPGPALDSHLDALIAALATETVTHIVVTHTHSDHSPAARQLAELTGATVYGFGPHPTVGADQLADDDDADETDETATTGQPGQTEAHKGEPWDADFDPTVRLSHGDRLDGPGWTLEAVHTPGHLANHLCYALVEEHTLFSGDHVMGWSTSVISPPGGDLADYLDSLELVAARDDSLYRPTHGPAISNPSALVRQLIAHRRDREAQILARLATGDCFVTEIVSALYDVVPALRKAAGRSVLSHLLALRRVGRVECEGLPGVTARWWLT